MELPHVLRRVSKDPDTIPGQHLLCLKLIAAQVSAKTFIRRYAQTASEEHSTSAAHAWICLSSVLQSGNADIELQAWGPGAISSGKVTYWIP